MIGKEEGSNMSFVAMIHNQNGIVAIADSKSTIEYTSGYKEEENGRETQKIFYNDKFILLTYGKNEIEYGNGNTIRLEDIMNSILIEGQSISDFMNQLFQFIETNQKKDIQYEYQFVVGFQAILNDSSRFVSQTIKITNKGMLSSSLHIKTGLIAGGCHSQIVTSLIVGQNWTVDEMALKLQALMDISMKLEDVFNTYSAIGGKITIISMDSYKIAEIKT